MNHSGAGATGRRLGRYHLAEPLGGGPTGEVFRAKVYGVAGFERQFAIKRFHGQLVAEPDRAAQLAQAARLYGALEHPRIARMHEFGVAGGETFTATELVRGVDLARLIDATFGSGRPLPAGAAVALLSAAARAVGFAHGRGLAHLGLCPTNVLCTAEGDVKVTDFGFLPLRLPARPAADPSLLARLPYLAPEQHRGESGTPATDVFQLGLLAYELLRGEPALTGGAAAEIEKNALSGEPAPLNVPKALGHVVRRALARSPYERFPDAGAMADALDAAVRATPLPGDRRDLAGLVRNALDQQAQIHELQMSGALRLPVPAPPRVSQQLTAETVAPPRAPTPPPVPAASAPAGPPAITRRPTPVPTSRSLTPVPTVSAVPPVTRSAATPPPIPAAPPPIPAAAAASGREQDEDDLPGAATTEMGAIRRPPVVPPVSITGPLKSSKAATPALRGAGAVPRPPDSGPGRSGLGSGRTGNLSGPTSLTPRRPTPVPAAPPRGPATHPRVATPVPPEPPSSRQDATSPGTEVGTDVATEVASEPGTSVETLTRSPIAGARSGRSGAVPVKLTDTQPGTGPTTLPALRSRTATEEEPDNPFAGSEHESDPDIFAGLFDESSGENAMLASELPRNERPTVGPPPDPAPADRSGQLRRQAEPPEHDGLPSPAQELEADEPPLLRTLVGHVPITGATNGARPVTTSPTRTSNIISRKRDLPAPAPARPATDSEPPDPGEVTVPRRSAAVRRVLPTEPPADAFERDTEMHAQDEEASSSILAAARRAADMGLAQPVAPAKRAPLGPTPRVPPGPESVEIEIVRPYIEPELGAIPTPLPGAATLPDMNHPQAPVPYMAMPPPYQPPAPMRTRGGGHAAKLLLGFLLLASMAAGGYFGYMALVDQEEDDSGQSATAPADPGTGARPAAAGDAGTAAPVAVRPAGDAGAAAPASTADAGAPVPSSGDLSINSTPPDADVYLDGAPVGKTPLRLDGSGDSHKLALILPGHKLHTAEVDGRGSVSVELEEVTPSSGPAGIKVKCKEKNRYYVIVDGVDTGQTCPTERIGSTMGEHVVEIYDPVNDSRKAFPINIEQTRLSHRIKVDY